VDESASGLRVFLRRLREEDIDERFASWFQNKDLMQYYRGNPKPMSRQDLLDELSDFETKGEVFVYAVVFAESNLVIGTIKIGPVHAVHRTSDLVVLLGDVEFHGKGLAVEAIVQGNNRAFTEHNVRKLHGGMYASNTASINAYLKAGWIIEGSLKDHYLVDGEPMDRVLVACFPSRD
jgi:RimJ/RimL family protein N-acetyltransferase